jgi:uracil-DNA glycosylase
MVKVRFARCDICPLVDRPLVHGQKGRRKNLVLIGEAPGYEEVEGGVPFIGKAGVKLAEILDVLNCNKNDLYISNSCLCHPVNEDGENRAPTQEEVGCCNERLLKSLEALKPTLVVALGMTAYYALTGNKIDKFSPVVGKVAKTKNGFSMLPTYHPAAGLRNRAYLPLMKRDLELALSIVEGVVNVN